MDAEAPILPCAQCGVGLPVAPEAREARCRHCGAVTPIGDAIREEARAYRVAVEAELRRMSFAETFSRGLGSGAFDRLMRRYMIAIFALAAVLTVGQMAPAFGLDPDLSPISVGVFVIGLALCMGAFFLSLRGAVREEMLEGHEEPPPRPTGELAAARVTSPCSACGGPVPFGLGEPTARCPYCGATVIPTEAVRGRLTAMASYRADLEQGRASRAMQRSNATGSLWRGLDLVFWVVRRMFFFMPLILGIAIGQSFLAQAPPPRRGRRPPRNEGMETIGMVMIGGGATLTALLFGGSLIVARLGKRTPRRTALEALARRYGSRVREDGTRAAIEWLDAHWAAAVPDEALVAHNSDQGTPVERLTVALHHRGAPVLVMFAEAPHVRRFDVFVAGHDPNREARDSARGMGPLASPAAMELEGAGLRVRTDRAGVHLWHPGTEPRFCEPGAAAWMLDRAVHLLGAPGRG